MQNAKLHEDLLQLKEGVITFMVSEGYWDDYSTTTQTIIEKHLQAAIKFVRDVKDPRVVKKWIDYLFRANIIERVDVRIYKFNNSEHQIDSVLKSYQTGQGEEHQQQPQQQFKEVKENNIMTEYQ